MSSSEEHKTFNKPSRWRHSRAATGLDVLGAGCTSTGKRTGSTRHAHRSISASMSASRGVPTDHEAHSQTQRGKLQRVATTGLRDCSLEAEAEQATHGRIRAPKRNSRNAIAVMLEPFARARGRCAMREPEKQSSGITDLHARRLQEEECGADQSSRPRTACEGTC